MANIKQVAGQAMNLYFQDYAETSQFWDVDDFIFFSGAAYGELLTQEWKAEYNRMLVEGDANIVTFSHDWLTTETIKKEKDENGFYLKLSQPIMSLPFDKRDIGIQNIFPATGFLSKEYVRSNVNEMWENAFLPMSKKVFWALLKDKIYLHTNLGEPPAESRVVYVPGISDKLDIPDTRVWAVILATVDMMRKAAANYQVKENADQNSNATNISDVDRNLIKP